MSSFLTFDIFTVCRGSITLELPETKMKRKFCFCVQTLNQDVFLCAKDEEEKKDWMRRVIAAATKDAQSPPDLGNVGAAGRKYLMQVCDDRYGY